MNPLRLHHIAVTITALMVVATAATYSHGLYPYAVWNAFLAGGFTTLTIWSFALEHGLRMPTPDHLDSRD